jgi:hypothetical protein
MSAQVIQFGTRSALTPKGGRKKVLLETGKPNFVMTPWAA